MRAKLASILGAALLIVGACGQTPVPTLGPTPTAAPTPSTTAAPTPFATPSPAPIATVTPAPTASSNTGVTAVVPASLPVRNSANYVAGFRMAARPDGGLFVAVPARNGTVLASLDAKGRIRKGWPVRLVGASACRIDVDPTDGSVRAACTIGESGARAFALDASGRQLPGWPVDLPTGGLEWYLSDPTGLVNGDLYVVLLEWEAGKASATLVRVAKDGSTRTGVSLRDDGLVENYVSIGPDGTAYVVGGIDETLVSALTLDGLATGWPISVTGWASVPSFGRDGRLYVTAARWPIDDEGRITARPSSQVYAFTRDGRLVRGWPVRLPIDTTLPAPDVASRPLPPIVAPDGSVYVVAGPRGAGTVAYSLGGSGRLRAGWPYRSRVDLVVNPGGAGTCGYPSYYAPPLAGPGGSLGLAQSTDRDGQSGANRVTTIGTNGKVRTGWPVTLLEAGAWFATTEVGAKGTVYGFAIEPAGTGRTECGPKQPLYSGTVVAFDGHGDPIYTTTLVAP